MKAQSTNVDAYCSCCKHKTHHIILGRQKEYYPTDDIWGYQEFQIVKCLGCDHVSFQLEICDETDETYDEYGNTVYISRYISYPDNGLKEAESLDFYHTIPEDLNAIYRESLRAYKAGSYRLTAAGFRATIEALCTDKEIAGKNLESKINKLCQKGIITRKDRDRLHAIRFIGNDSIHSIKTPNLQHLELVLEIINAVIYNLYVLDNKALALESPISTFEELRKIIDESLKTKTLNQVYSFNNLVDGNRRVLKDDRKNLETLLCDNINNGAYDRLQICPTPQNKNLPQQYKYIK